MKRVLKVSIFIAFLIGIMFFISEKANAVELNMNYTVNNNSEGNSKDIKVHPGDEIWVSINIIDEQDEKIMAIYGDLEYDKEALEIVNSAKDENNGEVQLGTGWTIGNVTSNTAQIVAYSTDEERNNNPICIKFKVKDNTKVKSTTIKAKDLVLYNTKYKEVNSNKNETSLEVKINKKSNTNFVKVIMIVSIIVIIAIIAIVVFVLKSRKK